MTRRTAAKFILCSSAVFIGLLALELAVRALSRRDEDGNVRFRDTRLKPYHVATHKAERIIGEYLASDRSVLVHDADLGWTLRAGVANQNRHGFLSASEPALEPAARVLRVALFGGSYTQGSFDSGWWRTLERALNEVGTKTEVLNFGVGGYGMDQAYLRWKRDGVRWKPNVVVFGWHAGNCYDNMNLVRMLKDPDTGVPFTKPRFLLRGDALELINSPTLAPAEIPKLMRDPSAWPLIAHDYYYARRDFQMTWWRRSRLGALIEAKAGAKARRESPEAFYAIDQEPARLALAITAQFQREAEAAGSRFFVVHLPHSSELDRQRATGHFPYEALYAALQKSSRVIKPEAAMLARCGSREAGALFHDGHYLPELHEVVGLEVAKALRGLAAPQQPAK